MTKFLPFSSRSKPWESHAVELREIACVGTENLCPWKLAELVGLLVVGTTQIIDELPSSVRQHLMGISGQKWSGGVLPKPLDSGHLICMLNPFQSKNRNKITLMEEVAHIHRDHQPTRLLRNDAGVTIRDYDKKQEEEAYGIGAAALLPWSSFFHSLKQGMTVAEMSLKYEVSEALVDYRIKVTGATSLFRSRQRSFSPNAR